MADLLIEPQQDHREAPAALCKHCRRLIMGGNSEFCSWEHYEYWYHEEQQRLFGQVKH